MQLTDLIVLATLLGACQIPNPAYRATHAPAPADGSPQDTGTPPNDSGPPATADGDVASDGTTPHLTGALALGLVGHWRFDDSEGDHAADSSGNENHGQLQGFADTSSAWVAGRQGKALRFLPSGPNQRVEVPSSPSLQTITRELSIAAWLWAEPTTAYWRTVLSRHVVETFDEHYGLTLGGDDLALIFSHSETGPTGGLRTPFSPAMGRWTHVVATFDGTTARLFSDGALLAEATTPKSFARASEPLLIGNNLNRGVHNEAWSGLLDDVMLWNRSLSPDEVKALVQAFP